LIEQSNALSDVKYEQGGYERFKGIKGYVFYCDPPYNCNTTRYRQSDGSQSFDYDKFIEWCRELSKHNLVLISEYKRPPNCLQVFKSDKISTAKGRELPRERLYIMDPDK
jgi:site-specific DNA-adenine methylase